MLIANFGDTAGHIVSSSIAPAITALSLLAAALCVLFIIIGGYQYMTSKGNPEHLMRAKKIIKNALIGLVIVIGASLLSHFLASAYGPVAPHSSASVVPSLSPIKPASSSDGLIGVIIKAIAGVLGSIIETVGIPFLKALSYFTTGTPLAASNHAVFNLWLSAVGMADALMVLVIVLIGLHTMGYVSLGLEQIDIRHILPQAGLAFVFINSSIFIIDAVISLSNVLIKAITGGHNAAQSVWQTLETVIKQPSTYSLAALIIMTIFLVFSVILLIYYVGRIVTIYLGAILAPLVILCWLLPSTRDITVAASKRYFAAIFVLFIHVVILELAASLLIGMTSNSSKSPDPLMAMIVGLATLVALLKTQGVMSQLSYATIGPRMTRKIAQRLILNTSYMGSQAASTIASFIPISGIGNTINVPGRDYAYRPPAVIKPDSIPTDKPNGRPKL
ncbi:MAG TPA: hypothetical protein VGF75_01595 [Candidatus Saccharimonadales bacterium]